MCLGDLETGESAREDSHVEELREVKPRSDVKHLLVRREPAPVLRDLVPPTEAEDGVLLRRERLPHGGGPLLLEDDAQQERGGRLCVDGEERRREVEDEDRPEDVEHRLEDAGEQLERSLKVSAVLIRLLCFGTHSPSLSCLSALPTFSL